MNRMQVRRRLWHVPGLATIVLAGVVAASASAGGTTASSARGTDLGAAKRYLASFLKQATSIGITTPLRAAPPKGKVVYWLQGNIGDITTITDGYKAATAALGWKLTTLTYDTTNPQALNGAMVQAVQKGANYIAVSGQPVAAYSSALKMAKAKGIPVFDSFSTNPVGGSSNGVYSNFGGPKNVRLDGLLTGAYSVLYWKGKANVLFVNMPDFPVLSFLMKADRSNVKKFCSDCPYDVLNVSTAQFTGGKIPGVVVAYLQSHPNVNTLRFAIGAMTTGVTQLIKSVGLKQKLIIHGSDPAQPNFKALISGTEQAWVGLPRAASAWYTADAMARYSLGMSLEPDASGLMPAQIFTAATVPRPAPNDYVPFPNYEAKFKTLWHVG